MTFLPSFPCSIGMVFGVFDGLHPGHQHFIREARRHCHTLIVVVAHDHVVKTLKQKTPRFCLAKRCQAIAETFPEVHVVPGDSEPGTWSVIEIHQPECIFLGYDQQSIAEALTERDHPHLFLAAHKPEQYKSSLLHQEP